MAAKGEHFQHNKRGSQYEVIGLASIQNANNKRLGEGDCMVVYRDSDGDLWTREESEFGDGRFTKIDTPAPLDNHTYAVQRGGEWRICVSVHASKYSDKSDIFVWSEVGTTAWVCAVGEEDQRVWLAANG